MPVPARLPRLRLTSTRVRDVTWTYKAKIDDPAVAGTTLVNNADAKTTSIGGSDPDERTASSSTNTGYVASSSSPVKITGATVTKSVDPAWATIGTPLTYTVDLTIPKDLAMFDLTAVDTLPDSLDFDGYTSATCVSGCPASPAPTVQTYNPVVTPSATTIAWDLGNITPGTTDRVIRFVFEAHVRDTYRSSGQKIELGANIVNVVRAQSNFSDKFNFDPNSLPAENTFDYVSPDAIAITPVRAPSVTLDKRVKVNSGNFVNGPVQSQPGDTLTYSVAVRNNGSSAAYDMVVTDQPDTTITNVVLDQGAGFNTDPWTPGDPTMKWTIPGPIAPGETVTLTYTAEPLPAAQLTNGSRAINTAGSNYWGLPASERTNPWIYRNYDSNDDTVRVNFDFPDDLGQQDDHGAGLPGHRRRRPADPVRLEDRRQEQREHRQGDRHGRQRHAAAGLDLRRRVNGNHRRYRWRSVHRAECVRRLADLGLHRPDDPARCQRHDHLHRDPVARRQGQPADPGQ